MISSIMTYIAQLELNQSSFPYSLMEITLIDL